MKRFIALIFLMLSTVASSDTAVVSLSAIYDQIQSDLTKSTHPSFVSRLEGTWYATHFQAQVFPSGCSRDRQNRVTPDRRNISLDLHEPLEVYANLQKVAGKLRWNGTHAATYQGNSLVSGSDGGTRCILKQLSNTSKETLVCFEPFYQVGNCGWYSFFIKI